MLNPFEAITKVIKDIIIITCLDKFKKFPFNVITLLPSTTIKLEIAFINVSILLIVKEIANTTTNIDKKIA